MGWYYPRPDNILVELIRTYSLTSYSSVVYSVPMKKKAKRATCNTINKVLTRLEAAVEGVPSSFPVPSLIGKRLVFSVGGMVGRT